MSNDPAYRDLVALWQRHDWRESLFAPGVAILQALLPDGSSASGAGRRRETALFRCLGETAEWQALQAAGATKQGGFASTRDGIAAHSLSETARCNAVLEAFERFAVTGWWLGRLGAHPVATDWLVQHGIADRIAEARRGAAQKRRTGLWQIDVAAGPAVMVCRSTSFRGQQPVLGYGCAPDPRRAAEKALREMLLMEVNLMELLAAGPTGGTGRLTAVRQRIESFARRCPSLLPLHGHVTPALPAPSALPDAAEGWFGTSLDLHDMPLTDAPASGQISVWLCRPAIPAPDLSDPDGSPFL